MIPHQSVQHNLPLFMPNANAGLDSSQVAKQMAALTAANQARISQNTRSTLLPTPGGISSGPYLGENASHSYPPGGHDLVSNANPHSNFQVPNNNYGLPQAPNSVANASFPDPTISQANQSRNQASGSGSLKQRQQGFLQGLAGLMAKRNTPLPPSLTGIPYPNYDPNNTLWSIIEPSSEIGSFRLAGRDVDLFKLWGLVFQQGGGHMVNANMAWGSILPHFDLPDEFPQMQANNSTSVALMLSQYYMAILFPFEEVYRKNLQDQRGKVSIGRQAMPAQQFPAPTPNAPRPPLGMPNTQPLGMRPINSNNLIPQGLPGGSIPSNGLAQYPSVHNSLTQHPPSSTSLPVSSIDTHPTMPSELDSLMHAVDSNLLDPEIQGIKRKHDQDDRDIKRARQKTDPPEGSSTMTGAPDLSSTPQTLSNSQAPSSASSVPSRPQPSRRKIEYVPLAREVDTYGGRDLKVIDAEWATIPLRRLRDINEWGTVDIETLAMSLRSRLAIEMTYALTTITVLSTMRGQTPGSGFPIYQCGDLFDELLDLMEELAFSEPEESPVPLSTDDNPNIIITNRELVSLVHEAGIHPFSSLEPRQGSKTFNLGPKQRPGIIIMAIINIVRNLSAIPDNGEFLSNHPRLIDMMLRLCILKVDDGRGALPASKHLSLSDLLTIRKDTLYTLSSISGLINLSGHASFHQSGLRIFDLVASYLVDPMDATSPLASVQLAGVVPSANLKPPALADVALEVFTRFSQADGNRQVIAKVVPPSSLWLLLTRLVHRLPIVDADFVLMQREYWLSFVEKTVMAIYSLVFLAPPDLKQKIKTDRTLSFKNVMLRMVHKAILMPSHDGRSVTIVSAKRAVEAMKVLDSTEDVFEQSETTMPILSFGMGFSDLGDVTLEKGTGILGGKGDVAWEMMMLRDVFQDERMFNELDSLVRVEI